ncbi:SDR family NAD(P)-dependent oxidoreductase, partial [Staphylococcus epidermidis]|uniref:SDR family NAD(P)-dependent oxidoreductase n=1 Tax=Staphylococcus epidermidis TaxID=1282 RepID=UPI00103D36D7
MERIVLITGGNKGLGFETAKVVQQKGYNVEIGSRDAERGRQAADELGVKYVQLDVTDDISIQQAYLQIQD